MPTFDHLSLCILALTLGMTGTNQIGAIGSDLTVSWIFVIVIRIPRMFKKTAVWELKEKKAWLYQLFWASGATDTKRLHIPNACNM